jgi:hypothetical protein
MAALDAIGHAAEAIKYTSMFQVWGLVNRPIFVLYQR